MSMIVTPSAPHLTPEFIASIAPAVHSRYSPNLYVWLTKFAAGLPGIGVFAEFTEGEKWQAGCLYVGMVTHPAHDANKNAELTGVRLMRVLSRGRSERIPEPSSYWREWTHLPTFWEDYQRIGRCIIDSDHSMLFRDDASRWSYSEDGKSRTCQWCGKLFEKKTIYRPEEIWEDVVEREKRLESACARLQAQKERGWKIAIDLGWEKAMRVLKKRGIPTLERNSRGRQDGAGGELVNDQVGHVYAASCWDGSWEAWGVTPAGEHWQHPGKVRRAEIEARLAKEAS